MKLWFQSYIERPNLTLYVARALILVKSGSRIRGGVEVELDPGLLLGVDVLAPPP
jgi:hypothetical protein